MNVKLSNPGVTLLFVTLFFLMATLTAEAQERSWRVRGNAIPEPRDEQTTAERNERQRNSADNQPVTTGINPVDPQRRQQNTNADDQSNNNIAAPNSIRDPNSSGWRAAGPDRPINSNAQQRQESGVGL